MKKRNARLYTASLCALVAFTIWTVMVCTVDVQPIGPEGSSVGFATVNRLFHGLTGVHLVLYTITDWLGIVPVGFCAGFAVLGFLQLIKRKNLTKVDADILVLGGFYVVVAAVYLLFEELAINYRPVLIQGRLEASYPSSTTLLVLCGMSTSLMQLRMRSKKPMVKQGAVISIRLFTACMVIGRLLSGVHWITDIVGGILLSTGLVLLYGAVTKTAFKEN